MGSEKIGQERDNVFAIAVLVDFLYRIHLCMVGLTTNQCCNNNVYTTTATPLLLNVPLIKTLYVAMVPVHKDVYKTTPEVRMPH